jgi:DNA-binding NarL/FixJ family response regulator
MRVMIAQGRRPQAQAVGRQTSLKLVLVSGEEHMRRMVRQVCSAQDWQFECFADCGQALAEIPAAKPDIVVMDTLLPGLPGVECARRLAQVLPNLPIVIVTPQRNADCFRFSLMAGARGYLIRPVSASDLVRVIAAAVQGWALLRSEELSALAVGLRAVNGVGPYKNRTRNAASGRADGRVRCGCESQITT